jgi:type I restriction enzyme R subunit
MKTLLVQPVPSSHLPSKCCYSTITGELEHFIEWKDPYPYQLADIDTEGGETVNSQQVLVQGMLSPTNLMDIIHSFTVFANDDKGANY